MTLRKRTIVFSIFVISIILISGTLTGAAFLGEKYYVNGRITTTVGEPLFDATVAIYHDNDVHVETITTGTDGTFSSYWISLVEPKNWKVVVTRDEFDSRTVTKTTTGTSTDFGDIELTAIAPPPKEYPTIATPTYVRNDGYEATFSVGVTWHYDPYIFRDVSIFIGSDELHLTQHVMNPIGGQYEAILDVEPRETYIYRIQATEAWYYSGTQYSATSNNGYYPVDPHYTSFYVADCYSTSDWDDKCTYAPHQYPVLPLSGAPSLLEADGSFSCQRNILEVPTNPDQSRQLDEHGNVFIQELTQKLSVSNLGKFTVELSSAALNLLDSGSVVVALYDDHTNLEDKLPIIFVKLSKLDTLSYQATLEIGYFDSKFEKYAIVLGTIDTETSSWSGNVEIWSDGSLGIWVDSSISSPQFIPTGANIAYTKINSIVMQWTRGYQGTQPEMSINGIGIFEYNIGVVEKSLDILTSIGLRSGCSSIDGRPIPTIGKPGPSNEMQLFPRNSGSIKYEVTFPSTPYGSTWIYLDARLLSPLGITTSCELKITTQSNTGPVDQFVTLQRGPNIDIYGVMDFIHVVPYLGTTLNGIIELSVSGLDWEKGDDVALRGIWIISDIGEPDNWVRCNLKQIFVTSSLTYYIPLGKNTELDFSWGDASSMDIMIDGLQCIHLGTPGYYPHIVLGDYSKDFHEITLVSSPGATVSIMHAVHDWLNIEIDYVIWNRVSYIPDDLGTIMNNIANYYESHTHGRISFELPTAGIRVNFKKYVHESGTEEEFYFNETEATDIGNIHFNNRGKRDWTWFFFVPDGINEYDTSIGGEYIKYFEANSRNRWVGAKLAYIYPDGQNGMQAQIMHELGHIAHLHEGVTDPPNRGEPCDGEECCIGNFEGGVPTYCMMHWYQTWVNIVNYNMFDPYWSEWWLL